MADHYHDPADLKLLKEMSKLAPHEFTAWLNQRRGEAKKMEKSGGSAARWRGDLALSRRRADSASEEESQPVPVAWQEAHRPCPGARSARRGG